MTTGKKYRFRWSHASTQISARIVEIFFSAKFDTISLAVGYPGVGEWDTGEYEMTTSKSLPQNETVISQSACLSLSTLTKLFNFPYTKLF